MGARPWDYAWRDLAAVASSFARAKLHVPEVRDFGEALLKHAEEKGSLAYQDSVNLASLMNSPPKMEPRVGENPANNDRRRNRRKCKFQAGNSFMPELLACTPLRFSIGPFSPHGLLFKANHAMPAAWDIFRQGIISGGRSGLQRKPRHGPSKILPKIDKNGFQAPVRINLKRWTAQSWQQRKASTRLYRWYC